MTWLLVVFRVFLLVLAIAGLAVLGFFAFKFHTKATGLDAELFAQQTRYDKDIKKWSVYSETLKAHHEGIINKCTEYSTALKAENQRLSKWKNVADADTKAAEMLRNARAIVEKATTDANNLIAGAQQRATSLQAATNEQATAELARAKDTASTVASEARAKAKAQKDEAQAILNSSTTQAAKVIDAANKKAEEIAGSAYEAMKNATLYEQTVKAMKNIIEGYGDQFIIPQQSLLDDLAEDFSHTQAGQELKRARECTKVMIRNGTSAACEYVEANRRETAINFVLDAFNGKVDSILSRAKHDNVGNWTSKSATHLPWSTTTERHSATRGSGRSISRHGLTS
jgi:hypothetical protein